MKPYNHLWILPFFSFFMGYFCFSFIVSTPIIKTPSLIGQNLTYAARLLSACNLNIRIVTQKEDNQLPDGTILNQIPSPGQTVKQNQTIFCIVSQKTDLGIAPNCIDRSLQEIHALYKKEGILIKKQPLESKHPAGKCIAQIPSPESPLEQRIMHIYIAHTNKLVVFPQLKELTVKEVLEFLKLHNLNPSIQHKINHEASHQCTTCKVLDQKPLSGSLVNLSKPLQIQLYVG
jgi:beta-lactam-binding protein with PASTA domain